MPGFLIIAHAPLASSLKTVAQHAFPEAAALLAPLDVAADAAVEDVEAQARELADGLNVAELLIFTDVFGATPCNVAQRLAATRSGTAMKVVAGVNVPMLWRSLSYAHEALESVAARAVSGATQGVMAVAVSRPQNQAVKGAAHDQPDRHNQQ